VKIKWIRYINPTGSGDSALGTCVFGDYIAVVGGVGWSPPPIAIASKPYVVLLHKSEGDVVKEWIGREEGMLYNCVSINGKLYAIGSANKGLIYVFDENLNILAGITSESPSSYNSLAYDGKTLYVGGSAYEDVNGDDVREQFWLVEKRDLNDLSLIASSKVQLGSWELGWIHDISVEPSTGRVWAVGAYQDSRGIWHSLIVVFDSSLTVLKVIDYPEGSKGFLSGLTAIAFDGWRYAYITGIDGIAKFSIDGELVVMSRDNKARYKIAYDNYNNKIYTFGEGWLYVHDTGLNKVQEYILSENVSALSDFREGKPALEGNNIYLAGIDYSLGRGDSRVVVYSLSLVSVTALTATGTKNATATVTPAYATVPASATEYERASTQLIVAGLAAIGMALATAFLLLRRR